MSSIDLVIPSAKTKAAFGGLFGRCTGSAKTKKAKQLEIDVLSEAEAIARWDI